MKIGFIGVGIMGKSMVRNLMTAGFEVAVFTRTKAKITDVLSEGAVWCETAAECAAGRDVVITIVGYPKDVEEVYLGEKGIIANAAPGTILIDMTTSSPKLAVEIYEAAKTKGMSAIDAPVTGGDAGAKNGTLTILAGGDRDAFDACLPVFEAMGKNINYMGKAGNGQHTKMCNQIAIAGAISGASEALAYAAGVGLDEKTMLDAISTGAAGSAQMSNVMPRVLNGDFAPGFFIKHFIKDMKLADEEASSADVSLGMLKYVLSMYEELEADGLGDLGTQALVQYYQKKTGQEHKE